MKKKINQTTFLNLEEELLVQAGEIKALERIALARDEVRQKKRKIWIYYLNHSKKSWSLNKEGYIYRCA